MIIGKLLWILFFIIEATCEKRVDKEEDVFIPTQEWQIVKKGQHIPKGLHVRINLETGITEAKLLDEDSTKNSQNALLEMPQENTEESFLEPEIIKETLKKIKGDDILQTDDIKDIKEKFRSFDELKKELNDLNLIPKVDAEILQDLFQQYEDEMIKDKINVYNILAILEDLDFLAHQIDNAVEFVRHNGFNNIIYKNLNSSENRIKQETLKLFGSLVQNNGKVQIHALETGSIGILLRVLHLEQSSEVKSRAVYALSCLLRRFPLAQLRFVENGGISVVTKLLEEEPLIKLQVKLITLMNDLLMENILALQDSTNENKSTVISQYQRVNLEHLLLKHGWCKYLNKLLFHLIATDPDNHDSIEKCVLAMHTVANKCVGQYSNDILTNLREKYKMLALSDVDRSDEFSNSDFFSNLHNLCRDLLQQNIVKTEL